MDSLHQTTENSSSSDRSPTHVASAPHLTLASPSRTTALEASSSSQLLSQHSPPAFSARSPQSEFFKGASHVDASSGTFNAVGGDQHNNITIEIKKNNVSSLKNLRRAKNAGYLSEHHWKCLEGTRRAELARIEKWEVDYTDKRVYWLNGMAGTGKSTIAQTFAERSAAGGRLGATFFCSRDYPDRRDIHLIFPTLAFGLARQYPLFLEALTDVLSSCPDAAEESLAIQLNTLLIQPLKSTKLSTTIVIDALDECEDDEPASAILSLLARHIDAIPSVKFFIIGRPEPQIRSGFRLPVLQPHTEVFVLHDVDPSSVDQDIELYLRTRLSEIAKERSDLDLTEPWPTDEDIAFLVRRCSGLFIVASIFARLVGDRQFDPQEQLKAIILDRDSTVLKGGSGVDKTYLQVFLRSFPDVEVLDTKFYDLLRLVVGSIVSVFSPLSCTDLAKILDIPPGGVKRSIRLLHSVLIIPDSDTWPLRICHKSFADFLINPRRCTDRRFNIELSALHMTLGTCCLRLMNGSLKRNICDLPPYVMNEDIDDLHARREKYIGSGLDYACRSWAKHLRLASSDGDDVGHVVELVEYFFKHCLLSWLEVLSIVGDMRCAVYSLRDVKSWFIHVQSQDANLLNIMKDGERFILRFFDAIGASACHIYNSALPWSPGSSLVRALYLEQISAAVKMLNAIDDLWDASTRTIQMRHGLYHIAFSHKDDFIAVAEIGCVEVFETFTGHRRATFTSTETAQYRSLAFSPEDTLLVTGRDDGIIDVWDLQTGGLVSSFEGHTDVIRSVAFSPCGIMIASCSDDHTVRIWNVSKQGCRYILEGHSDSVRSVCWSSTSKEVISGSSDETVRMWGITEKRCMKTFVGCRGGVVSVASSPDSSFVASGSFCEVKIFNVRTGDVFQTITTDDLVESVRFLDQDKFMYATQASTFVIHDLTETINTPGPISKHWLNRCFRKARLRFELLQTQTRRSKTGPAKDPNVFTFKYHGHTTAISSDGTHIASSTGSVVKIWQTYSPNPNYDMASHHDYVRSVAFSGVGQLIASGSDDNTAKLWDPTTARCLHTFSHPDRVTSVTFSPDSKLLASGSFDRKIRIWDTRTHNLISTFETPERDIRYVHISLGFSPNGNRLVSLRDPYYLDDGTSMNLELWEIATGKCLASIEVNEHFDKVAFGVDGTSVILEMNNETVRWSISLNQSTTDGDKDDHSSLPMEFVPLHDAQQSIPTRFHHYRRLREWILDEQERRVLWIPPDMRHTGDSYGKMVVLGAVSGLVPIVNLTSVTC